MTPSCESFASVFVLLLIWGFKWGVVFPLDEMIPVYIFLAFFFFFWEKGKPMSFFWLFLMYVCIHLNLSFHFIFSPEFMEVYKCSCLGSPPDLEMWNSTKVRRHCKCHLLRGEERCWIRLHDLRTLLLGLLVCTETLMEHKAHRQDGKPKMMRYIKRLEQSVKRKAKVK